MKKLLICVAVLAVFALASCTTYQPVAGATGTVGSKTGEASQTFICGFPGKVDGGGIAQAAKNGGITRVGTVDIRIDYPASPVFAGFYHIVTTVVTGE